MGLRRPKLVGSGRDRIGGLAVFLESVLRGMTGSRSNSGGRFPLAALFLLLGACGLLAKFAVLAASAVMRDDIDRSLKLILAGVGLVLGSLFGLLVTLPQPVGWRLHLLGTGIGGVLGAMAMLVLLAKDWEAEGAGEKLLVTICIGSVMVLILGYFMRPAEPVA